MSPGLTCKHGTPSTVRCEHCKADEIHYALTQPPRSISRAQAYDLARKLLQANPKLGSMETVYGMMDIILRELGIPVEDKP